MIWVIHFISVNLLFVFSKLIKKDKFFVYSSFIYALFIFGQRWMTGTDFPNYLKYILLEFQVREPIYNFFQNLISSYNLYFGLLIFVVFAITLFNNYRFMLKIDRNVVLIIYIYLLSEIFFAQLSQIRQFIAISFFLNAYYSAFKKNYKSSFINILLGAGFHTSIIFLVPFLFIRLNINRIKALYILLVSAVLPLFDVTLLLKLPFFSRYAHYIESRFNVNLSMFHVMKFYVLLMLIFIFVWNLKKYRNTTLDQMILNGILFNVLIYSLSFQFAPMIRINAFFKIFEIVFLVYYLKEIDNFSAVIKKNVVILFFFVTYLGFALTDPYKITYYQFQPMRIRESRSTEQLWVEINNAP